MLAYFEQQLCILFSASSCGTAPPADPNGNVYIAAVNASFYGTVLRYSCNQGYDLIGQPTLFCDSNGSYVGNPGTCKSK